MGEKDDMKDKEEEKSSEESEETEEPRESEDSEETEETGEPVSEETEDEAETAEETSEGSDNSEEDAEDPEDPSEDAEDGADEEEAAEAAEAEAAPSQEEAVEEPIAEESAPEPEEPAVEIEAAPRDVEGVAAFFDHPKHLLAAATYARDSDYEEFDAYSPFPIHGMDEAMGLGPSWIPWVTFGAGATGFVLANAMQFGMMTFDWPMIVGGKPFAPWPSFVPIMFELTVLLAGVTTAVVMLKAAGCFQKPTIIDPRITDDRFVLWISANDDKFDEDQVTEFLEDLNPLEVRKIVKDV